MSWRTGMIVAAVLALRALPASAYFIQYEGNVFPEDDGWAPPPIDTGGYTRSIDDGVFMINAGLLDDTTVFYKQSVDILNDAVFFEWRARTSNDEGSSYQSIMIDGEGLVSNIGISWRSTSARIALLPDAGQYEGTIMYVDIIPDQYHTYRIEANGAMYSVYIDDVYQVGAELQSAYGTNIYAQFGFGKDWYNVPTIAEWDYIRGGYVPEPTTAYFVLVAVLLFRKHY